MYLDKERGHYDLAKGMDYMKELADKENDMAQYTLGRILLDPESGAYDAKEGMEYLTRSAEHGNEYAQLKLGLIYLSGADKYPGIMKDKEMARKYLELAAEKNDLAKDILSHIDNYRGGLPFVIAGKNRISLRGNSSDELEKALHNIEKSMGEMCIRDRDNGSLMWQTVISFDNRWLEKYGLYDAANDIVAVSYTHLDNHTDREESRVYRKPFVYNAKTKSQLTKKEVEAYKKIGKDIFHF